MWGSGKFQAWRFYPRGRTSVPLDRWVGWVPELVETFWRGEDKNPLPLTEYKLRTVAFTLSLTKRLQVMLIYMQSNKIHRVFQWLSLFSTYVSSTRFGPHRSIIRSVLYKLYSQTLVCGTTVRTTRHVQPLLVLAGRVEQYAYYHIPKSANTACTKRSWWWTGEVRNM